MILHFLLLLLCLPRSDAQNQLPNVSTDNVALAVKLSSQLTKLDVKDIRDSMESIRLDEQEARELVKEADSLLVAAKEAAVASPPDLDLEILSKATAISKKKKAIELTKSHKGKLRTFHAVLQLARQLETDARETAELLDKDIHRLIATENYADAKEVTKQLRILRSAIDNLQLSEGYQAIAARLMEIDAVAVAKNLEEDVVAMTWFNWIAYRCLVGIDCFIYFVISILIADGTINKITNNDGITTNEKKAQYMNSYYILVAIFLTIPFYIKIHTKSWWDSGSFFSCFRTPIGLGRWDLFYYLLCGIMAGGFMGASPGSVVGLFLILLFCTIYL
jgi:hypothetical protein